jgi:hypothetical protein
MRYRVDPGDIPPEKAARRLHLTLDRFNELLPGLVARDFPQPDLTTGNYDLDEIDRWRRDRHRHNPQAELTPCPRAASDGRVLDMGERFRAAKNRKRHG